MEPKPIPAIVETFYPTREGFLNNPMFWKNDYHPFMGCEVRATFLSPYTEQSKHNGKRFVILGLSSKDEFDMKEVGPYYRIRFEDGDEMDADPIEIYTNVGYVGGVPWT
jgi:hypothetical protein